MAEIKTLLDDVIEKELENLDNISDREEKSKVIRDITQLHKLRIDEVRTKIEADDKEATLLCEREKSKRQNRDNWIDRSLKLGGSVITFVSTLFLANRCLKFEETGTISSFVSKNLFSGLFRFKK